MTGRNCTLTKCLSTFTLVTVGCVLQINNYLIWISRTYRLCCWLDSKVIVEITNSRLRWNLNSLEQIGKLPLGCKICRQIVITKHSVPIAVSKCWMFIYIYVLVRMLSFFWVQDCVPKYTGSDYYVCKSYSLVVNSNSWFILHSISGENRVTSKK